MAIVARQLFPSNLPLTVRLRILGRRIGIAWTKVPRWARRGLYVSAFLVWLRYALIVVLA